MEDQKYIKIGQAFKPQSGLQGNLTPGTLHLVIQEIVDEDRKGVYVMGVGRPVKLYPDEFRIYEGSVNAEILEEQRKNFEKSQQDSKRMPSFVSSVNHLKNKKMNKGTQKTEQSSNLTKTEMQVAEAIIANPLKGKAVKSDNDKMIEAGADLATVDASLPGIDAPKVCRKMHRAGLITYVWNEDKTRTVSITQEGFDAIQLGVRVPKEKAPKAEKVVKEKAPKAEKVAKEKEAPAKGKGSSKVAVIPEVTEDDDNLDDTFDVKANPVSKTFTVTIEGKSYTLKVKTAQEFKDCKANSYEEWLDLVALGELTEVEA